MLRLFGFVFLLHAFVGWRLLPDLPFGAVPVAATTLWLVASAVVIPLGLYARRMKRQPLADRLTWASLMAIGSFSSLFVLALIRDVGLLVGAASLEGFREYSALAVPALAALATLAGFVNARRRARVRRVDVPIADLPAPLHGFSIAQISDIHVGATIKREYLDGIVDAVNDLEADMIAVTGDLVDGSVGQLAQHTAPLARLSARHGAFFVTGNHEYYSGASAWVGEVRRLGLSVLMNEHVVLEHEGAAIVVAGVTDYSAHHFDPAHRSNPAAAIAGAPSDARGQGAARAPAAVGVRRGAGGFRPPALRPHARRSVLPVDLPRAPAAAVHRRAPSPGQALGLHQPRHRLLGAAEAARRAVGDHVPPARTGVASGARGGCCRRANARMT